MRLHSSTPLNIGVLLDPYGEANPSGLGKWVLEIVSNLLRIDTQDAFTLYVKKESSVSHPWNEKATIKVFGERSLWWSGGGRFDTKQDLYLFLTPMMPLTFFPKRSIVTAHDFAYLQLPSSSLRSYLSSRTLYLLHAISFWKATRIVCISEATRTTLHSYFPVSRTKTVAVPLSAVDLDAPLEEMNVPSKFFLFAGVLKERKNVRRIVEGFGAFIENTHNQDTHLCISGRTGGSYYEELVTLTKKLGIESRVHFLGYVTNGQLRYLYVHALALVFPSLVEGFGMPLLEAMKEGLPVITSNHGALAEVAGDAGILVDAYDSNAIGQAMERIESDAPLRADLQMRGRARAAEFSWEKTAQKIQGIIQSL